MTSCGREDGPIARGAGACRTGPEHWRAAADAVPALLMIGVVVVAIPGNVPLAIELVLQPTFAVIKFLVVTLVTFLLRSLSTFLLSQWAEDVDVPQRLR